MMDHALLISIGKFSPISPLTRMEESPALIAARDLATHDKVMGESNHWTRVRVSKAGGGVL